MQRAASVCTGFRLVDHKPRAAAKSAAVSIFLGTPLRLGEPCAPR